MRICVDFGFSEPGFFYAGLPLPLGLQGPVVSGIRGWKVSGISWFDSLGGGPDFAV